MQPRTSSSLDMTGLVCPACGEDELHIDNVERHADGDAVIVLGGFCGHEWALHLVSVDGRLLWFVEVNERTLSGVTAA